MPPLFLGVYLGFVKLSQLSGGGSVRLGRLAGGYVYSLVPIAIAYQVAHYYTCLLIQGQGIISHLSDPFGWGWNLFGTADYEVRIGIVDAAFVWLFASSSHRAAIHVQVFAASRDGRTG
jgi:hypothetical protein